MTTNPGPQSGRFSDVDATRQAEPFVTFLEWIEGLPSVMELRKRSYELLDAHPVTPVILPATGAPAPQLYKLSRHGPCRTAQARQ